MSDEPYEFRGSMSEIIGNFSLYGGAVKAYSGVVAAFLIIFSYNSIDLMSNHWDVIQDATTEEAWSLSFVEEIEILEEAMVLQDEEKQTFTFYLDDIDVPDGFLIGELNITVDDTGNDGLIANNDPTNECDSVLADVREGGLTSRTSASTESVSYTHLRAHET